MSASPLFTFKFIIACIVIVLAVITIVMAADWWVK